MSAPMAGKEKVAMKVEALWHGIPRKDIPWFPAVSADKCIGCSLCYVTCGRGVFEMEDNKAIVRNPYGCMVGCSTCGAVCPVEAIDFPSRQLVWKLEREHKIFRLIRQEARDKRAKLSSELARAQAEDAVAKLTMRVRFEVSGEFGEKRFLIQLEELVKDRPFDIVGLRLDVPTVKGAAEKTPSFLAFEVTSTNQEDISECLSSVREVIRKNSLVLVSETKI